MHYTNCRKPWQCSGVSSTVKGDIDPRTAALIIAWKWCEDGTRCDPVWSGYKSGGFNWNTRGSGGKVSDICFHGSLWFKRI